MEVSLNGKRLDRINCAIGEVPVMIRSNRCHLNGLKPKQLIRRGEDVNDPGGYFICNGSEKVMRLIIANKQNFPVAIKQRAFRERGKVSAKWQIFYE